MAFLRFSGARARCASRQDVAGAGVVAVRGGGVGRAGIVGGCSCGASGGTASVWPGGVLAEGRPTASFPSLSLFTTVVFVSSALAPTTPFRNS